jgi:PAS domain-containing protein
MVQTQVGLLCTDKTKRLMCHSSHPRESSAHEQFSFMQLIHPEDQPLVLRMWNTLAQGSPVTFEMRWKPRPGTNDVAQWALSACVPIYDENDVLISIAGNVIDISAQKKAQEATQARIEALEQARVSEMKFARFAQLSRTAIYIFSPENGELATWKGAKSDVPVLDMLTYLVGMKYVNDQFYELTGHPRGPIDRSDWFSLIADEDVEIVGTDWAEILGGKISDGVQFRLKKTWVNQDGVKDNIWVQSSSYPQFDEQDNVHSELAHRLEPQSLTTSFIGIMGNLIDISQFKWAESVQRRRTEEALEAKRQQEKCWALSQFPEYID